MSDLGKAGRDRRRPLAGRRILVTRPTAQAEALTAPLRALGAEPVVCPTIEIIPSEDPAGLAKAMAQLGQIDFLILSSVNAVEFFFSLFQEMGLGLESLQKIVIVAVGPKTAQAIEAHGCKVDMIPAEFRAEGIIDLIRDKVPGKRVLYPRAGLARDLIPAQLADAGARVLDPVAYTSAMPLDGPAKLQLALASGLDLITFTASSTVRNFVQMIPHERLAKAQQIPVASIGPLTSQTARECGLQVVVEPKEATLEAMIDAIEEYFSNLTAMHHAKLKH